MISPSQPTVGQKTEISMKEPSHFRIITVRSEEDLKDVIELFYEYTKWLDLDLSFQNFNAEMAGMPGKYAPPRGELFLARSVSNEPLGCIAVRPLIDDVCEMKRLWVRDSAKGQGVGKALVTSIVEAAKQLGYQKIRLDTLPRMAAAVSMYQSFGFVDIDPYYATPLSGTHFLELDLVAATPSPVPGT